MNRILGCAFLGFGFIKGLDTIIWGYIGVILGLYRNNGKENGNRLVV